MRSEDIRDKETERLKRSIRTSAIIHLVLIAILSIPIIKRHKEISTKLLEVHRITEVEAKETIKKLEETKTAEKKAEAEREIEKYPTEIEIKADDVGKKEDLEGKLTGSDNGGVEESVREFGKPYVPPSVGPEVGEEEKKGIIEAEVEITDDVSEVSAQDNKTGDIRPEPLWDKMKNALTRYREKKLQERRGKRDDIVIKDSLKKSQLLDRQGEKGIAAMESDVSHDKAKFLSYAKTYSTFGKEKKRNVLIDFSFSSLSARRSLFQKYDIRTVPRTEITSISIKEDEKLIYVEAQEKSEHHRLYRYYFNKYGVCDDLKVSHYCYVGEKYLYYFPWTVGKMLVRRNRQALIEKYGVTERELDDFLESHKVVIVEEIDEKRLEFRIRELEVFDID